MEIKDIKAKEVRDSRGNPALAVSVFSKNFEGFAIVPSGASTGTHEVVELRDEDGRGLNNAIEIINTEIRDKIIGLDPKEQEEIDRLLIELDGTENKSRLGGNVLIGVSMAVARLGAKESGLELFEYLTLQRGIKTSREAPLLFINLINGGKHANGGSSFQEHHIVPMNNDLAQNIKMGREIQNKLKEILLKEEKKFEIGDEGGFVFKTSSVEEPFFYLERAINESGYKDQVFLGADIAADSFYRNGRYKVFDKDLNREELEEIYKELFKKFNIKFIEDPFEEEDFVGFSKLQSFYPQKIIIGDDLTTTNVSRIRKAIDNKSIRGVIIKPNQIGTLTEVFDAIELARDYDIECIISHRSGEVEDDFIADLAIATGCFAVKFGAFGQKEREIKYNRLKKIFENGRSI